MDDFNKELKAVGYISSDFPTKFGVPRQSGLCGGLISRIVLLAPYNTPEAFRGIEEFSHIWVLWSFSDSVSEKFSPTVRPPRLGGNRRIGVFASRSPFRPNSIGLSCVKLERVVHTGGGIELEISGADMKDGTPVVDIKPYIPYADCIPEASGSFAQQHSQDRLSVVIPDGLLQKVPEDKRSALTEVLSLDPRPAYQDDEQRVYGFGFAGMEIRFTVSGSTLTVTEVE